MTELEVYYLALDISLNSTGYAVLNQDQKLIDFGTFAYKTNKDEEGTKELLYKKIKFQSKKLTELLEQYKPEKVFIEKPSFGSFKFSNSITPIIEVTGVLKFILGDYNYIPEAYPPTTVKKIATGKGNAKKEEVQIAIKKLYPSLDSAIYPSDVYDAIAIGLTGLIKKEKENAQIF